jgi:hypothetical protein
MRTYITEKRASKILVSYTVWRYILTFFFLFSLYFYVIFQQKIGHKVIPQKLEKKKKGKKVKARHSRRNNGGYARGLGFIIEKSPLILLEFPLEDPMFLCEITKLPHPPHPPNLHEQVGGIKDVRTRTCTLSLQKSNQKNHSNRIPNPTSFLLFCTQRVTLGHEKERKVRILVSHMLRIYAYIYIYMYSNGTHSRYLGRFSAGARGPLRRIFAGARRHRRIIRSRSVAGLAVRPGRTRRVGALQGAVAVASVVVRQTEASRQIGGIVEADPVRILRL